MLQDYLDPINAAERTRLTLATAGPAIEAASNEVARLQAALEAALATKTALERGLQAARQDWESFASANPGVAPVVDAFVRALIDADPAAASGAYPLESTASSRPSLRPTANGPQTETESLQSLPHRNWRPDVAVATSGNNTTSPTATAQM